MEKEDQLLTRKYNSLIMYVNVYIKARYDKDSVGNSVLQRKKMHAGFSGNSHGLDMSTSNVAREHYWLVV